MGGAGISENHALAIVNRGGSTSDVMALAAKIEEQVYRQFGIRLQREPVVVRYKP
jgi:UDP-N-acetylmuramate dehydrogenase